MNEHDFVFPQLSAYSLDALDPEEAERVRLHLTTCSICQSELASYQRIVDELLLAVSIHEPPSGLKTRLLKEIVTPLPQNSFTAQLWLSLSSFFNWIFRPRIFRPLLAILLLALLTGNVLVWRSQRATIDNNNPQKLRAFPLVGDESFPTASGYILVSSDGLSGAVVVDELPILAEDQTYQLWLIQPDQQRDSGAIFTVDDLGYGGARIEPPQTLWNYRGFGITIEPAEGSAAPTGQRVLFGELP